VLDVTIVADNAVLHEVHEGKMQYYDVPDIRTWIARNISGSVVNFSSVTLSWRGDGPCISRDLVLGSDSGVADPKSALSRHL